MAVVPLNADDCEALAHLARQRAHELAHDVVRAAHFHALAEHLLAAVRHDRAPRVHDGKLPDRVDLPGGG